MAVALAGLTVGGCRGEASSAVPSDGGASAQVIVADTTLVSLLADLHVLDARRCLVQDTSAVQGLRDSVLARHGYDEIRLAAALSALATNADLSSITWLSVQDRVDLLLRPPAQIPTETSARRIDG